VARLFVAALPTGAVIDRLRALPRPDEAGVRWVPESNWHVTLRFLGEGDADEAAELLERLEAPRCRATLGPAVERLGDRQITVPVAGVDGLAAAVGAATRAVGPPPSRPFVGHLTIARTKPAAPSAVLGAEIRAEFDVTDVALMASNLRSTRATYSTLATFPLG
jgi:2'-5' RNA ligase